IVFVIGAGVGEEYRMPLGGELKNRITTLVNFRSHDVYDQQKLQSILLAHFKSDVTAYEDAGHTLAKAITSPEFRSIDEALKWFAPTPIIVELGKIAIVWEILAAERSSPLYATGLDSTPPGADFQDTWLPHFLSMAISDLQSDEAERAFENVTV